MKVLSLHTRCLPQPNRVTSKLDRVSSNQYNLKLINNLRMFKTSICILFGQCQLLQLIYRMVMSIA